VPAAAARARAAEDRAREISQRAETRRVESERHAVETVEKARALAEKTVTEARSESQRLLSEARTEAELTTQAAKRDVDDLTRQKDAVTNQLGQMLSGLSGLVPTVGAAAKAAEVVKQAEAKPDTPAQRPAETGDAGKPEAAAKTS